MTTKLFYCSRCKTETNHREQDNGTYICRVCGHVVSRENAEIAILFRGEGYTILDLKREAE